MIQPGSKPLDHLGVLVTRPAHQSQHLLQLLAAAGASTFAFPVIEIRPLDPDSASQNHLDSLQAYQVLIFISANAVNYGIHYLRQPLASNQQIAAIGSATASALEQHHLKVDLKPTAGFTAEKLLEPDALQADNIANQKVLIFRGRGGRETLADSLRQRGASVDYVEVYQRCMPETDIDPIIKLWAGGQIQLVTVSSNESLENLYHMAGDKGQGLLRQTGLVVPGRRCAELAKTLGFTSSVIVAESATDEAMLQAIQQWYKHNINKA